jgi:hypothetical protein
MIFIRFGDIRENGTPPQTKAEIPKKGISREKTPNGIILNSGFQPEMPCLNSIVLRYLLDRTETKNEIISTSIERSKKRLCETVL